MSETQQIEINPVYEKYLYYSQEYRYIFLFGSANSAKSYEGSMYLSYNINNNPDYGALVVRKTYNTIKDSIFDSLRRKFDILEITDLFKFNTRPCEIACKDKAYYNNKIIFKGAQDVEKVKSLNNINAVLAEEMSELEENDFLQLDIRMRGETKTSKQFIGIFNPVADNHWLVKYVEPQLLPEDKKPKDIKEINILEYCELSDQPLAWEIIREVEGKTKMITLKTLVLNTNINHNLFATEEDHAQLNSLASLSDIHYTVYKKGRWGKINEGDMFIPTFNKNIHVQNVEYLKDYPIHYTCDFNTKPYMTGVLCQYIPNELYDEIRIFEENILYYPNNNSYALGETLVEKYGDDIFNNGCFIYGDASGNNKLGIKNTTSLFADLMAGLGDLRRSCKRRVPAANPRYGNEMSKNFLARRLLMEKAFAGIMPNKRKVKITIDRKCNHVIKDFTQCTQDANGKLFKKKNKDGVEEIGHCMDAITYFTHHIKVLGKYRKLR